MKQAFNITYFAMYPGQQSPQRVYLGVDAENDKIVVEYNPNLAYRAGVDNTQYEPENEGKDYRFYFKAVPSCDFADEMIRLAKPYLPHLAENDPIAEQSLMMLVNDMDDDDFLTWTLADYYFQNCEDQYDDKLAGIGTLSKEFYEVLYFIDDDCYRDGDGVYIPDLTQWLMDRCEFVNSEVLR